MRSLISLIRKLFKQLKSDLTPAQLAVGAFFGALAGLTPLGPHLHLILTLALLFNCSMASFLLIFGALKPLGFALGRISFSTGTSLIGALAVEMKKDQVKDAFYLFKKKDPKKDEKK